MIILRAAATHGLGSVLYHYYTSKNDAAGLIPTATSCVQRRHLAIDVKAGQNSPQTAPGGCKVNMESSYPRPLCLPLGKLVRWHYHLVIQGCKYLCYYRQTHPAAFPGSDNIAGRRTAILLSHGTSEPTRRCKYLSSLTLLHTRNR